jgi:hypothetical protein
MERDPRPGLPLKGGPRTMAANTGSGIDHGDVDVASPPLTVDRITVALIPKAAKDLQLLQERTGLSKTDLANRAITLYEFIDAQMRTDRDVLVRDNNTGETQVIRLL